jgi:hypothetical protein
MIRLGYRGVDTFLQGISRRPGGDAPCMARATAGLKQLNLLAYASQQAISSYNS